MTILSAYGKCSGPPGGLKSAYSGGGLSGDAGFGLKAAYRGGLFCAGGAGGDPAEIVVDAVNFDGVNDWLERDGALTGNVDGQKGTLAFWLNMNGGDGAAKNILYADGGFLDCARATGGELHLKLFNSAATTLLDMLSTNTRVAADGWVCVLMSWDLSAALKAHLFFNDVDETNMSVKIEGTVDYTRADYAFGARVAGALKLTGCLSQFYFNPEEYIDFTVEANRRKFVSAGGKPVDMGADGSGPTGSVPLVFLSGATASWHTNKGDGGGMTENGALVSCSSPSGEFVVNAVNFDGTNDWLNRSLLVGANSENVLLSLWFNILGGDAALKSLFQSSTNSIQVHRQGTNKFNILLRTSTPTTIWGVTTTILFDTVNNPGWHHMLIAAELDVTPVAKIYIDDVEAGITTETAPTNGSVAFADGGNWGVGATATGSVKFDGDLSEVYCTNEYLDITVKANRRKFITAGLKPVDLGADGSTPTGTQAAFFFSGPTINWHANLGSGGVFIENGALANAASSPSD